MRVVIPEGPPPSPAPAPRLLVDVLRDVEKMCAKDDEDIVEDPALNHRALALLRELSAWVGMSPSPSEKSRIQQFNLDPSLYVSLPVDIEVNQHAAGGIAQIPTPKGVVDVVFFNLVMTMPLANLNAPKVLLAGGSTLPSGAGPAAQVANPAEGALPVFAARWCLPRARVAQHVLQHVGLEEKPRGDG